MNYFDHIKDLAEKQYYSASEDGNFDTCVGFEFQGQYIVNPWLDQSTRAPLTTEEAFDLYGEENMLAFAKMIDKVNTPSVIGLLCKWGEDDYELDQLDLPEDISNEIAGRVEEHCGCSVRGSAESILEELRQMTIPSPAVRHTANDAFERNLADTLLNAVEDAGLGVMVGSIEEDQSGRRFTAETENGFYEITIAHASEKDHL